MHQYNYQYIFILVWRSIWKVSWQKQWSHDNCNLLIFGTGKRCRKCPVYCSFVLNTPNCLQQNEIFKILQRKHSGFWVTSLHSAMNRVFGSHGFDCPWYLLPEGRQPCITPRETMSTPSIFTWPRRITPYLATLSGAHKQLPHNL